MSDPINACVLRLDLKELRSLLGLNDKFKLHRVHAGSEMFEPYLDIVVEGPGLSITSPLHQLERCTTKEFREKLK